MIAMLKKMYQIELLMLFIAPQTPLSWASKYLRSIFENLETIGF